MAGCSSRQERPDLRSEVDLHPAARARGAYRGRDAVTRHHPPRYNGEMTRFAIVLSLTALAVACRPAGGPAASPAPSANAWAVVNGHEITRDEVEKAYRRAAPENQTPSEEEAYTAKLNLLNELIVQNILLAKASRAQDRAAGERARERLQRGEEKHSAGRVRGGAEKAQPHRRRHA